MFGGSYRLGRVFGIPIGIHWSLLLVLGWILYSLTGSYQDLTGDQTSAFLLALGTAFLFYLSILLHELGHAIVARRNKIGISGIDLWMLGGVAKMTRDADSPGVEFRIAIAGPMVTAVIAAALVAGCIAGFGYEQFNEGFMFRIYTGENGVLAMLAMVASINIVLLGFNLIPAFPLDGGRVARSIAWKVVGDRARATNFAATLGQIFGFLLISLGVFIAITTGDVFNGVYFAFLGWMISGWARAEMHQTTVLSKIEGVRVEDVMDREPVAMPGDMTVEQAMHEFFLRYRYPWFPVVDSNGRYVGVVELERAQHVADEKQSVFKVNEIMRSEGDQFRVRDDDPLDALLSNEPLRRLGALIAVDRDGRLKGIVTVEQISKALRQGAAPSH